MSARLQFRLFRVRLVLGGLPGAVRVAISVLVGALWLSALPAKVVYANTIAVAAGEVTINDDGICSLREAIENANDTVAPADHDDCADGDFAGADTIELANGSTYALTAVADTTDGQNGLPSITTQITLHGNGALIERASNLTCVLNAITGTTSPNLEFRIFHVGNTGNLTLDNLTVRRGCADALSFPARRGSGLYNLGTVAISNTTFSANAASDNGGAVYNLGTATITHSSFSNNSANRGGGLFNDGGAATISNSTFANNSAGSGGGLDNEGTATISDTTFSANSAAVGGGLQNSSIATISNSTFTANSASNRGGGMFNQGTATIGNTTFSINSAQIGGGLLNEGGTATISSTTFTANSASNTGGGLLNEGGTATISNTTFSANSAQFGGGLLNGGDSTATISNTTFSTNSASSQGGGLFNFGTVMIANSTFSGNSAGDIGGGLLNDFGIATISSSTFAANSASAGGGIRNSSGQTVNLKSTIIANNSGSDCSNQGSFNASGNNLDSDSTCAGFTLHANPLLSPLQNNGGPTQTRALLAGSPALDAATDCTLFDGTTPLAQDQRGLARPSGTQCDLGPYEATILSVLGTGTGSGMILDSGFNCTSISGATSGDCVESITGLNLSIALGTKPAAGSVFSRWDGDPDCVDGRVTVDSNKTCIATFNLIPQGVDLTGTFTKNALTCKPNKNPEINIKFSVQNLGPLTTSKAFPFNVNFFLSADSILDGGDTLLLAQTIQKAIKPGKSTNISKKVKPAIACPAGNQVVAQVDVGDTVHEVNEKNNFILSTALALPASANLIAVLAGRRGTAAAGQNTIEIYDLRGQKLIEHTSAGELRSEDVSDLRLTSGVYLYVVSTREADGKRMRREVRKLIIQR